MKLKLSNGLYYGEGPDGKRVCRGALMGRPDNIPDCVLPLSSVKLHLVRLKMYDGDCYDAGGAYWGSGNGTTHMYCAWGTAFNPRNDTVAFPPIQIFVRAKSRKNAKAQVRDILPFAKFFR
jgi:hypothetical protein